jgi:hypothetical protein
VNIIGADPYLEVTLITQYGGPFDYGQTDAFGNFQVTTTLDDSNVSHYEEHWYVNEVEITAYNNQNLPIAPILPAFDVLPTYIGTVCPGISPADACPSSPGGTKWEHTPITYQSSSSIVSADSVSSIVASWNSITSNINITPASATPISVDVSIADSNPLPTVKFGGETFIYGNNCNRCFDYFDECTGRCADSAGIAAAHVLIYSNNTQTTADALGYSQSTVGATVLAHELGHVLRLLDVLVKADAGLYGRCSEVSSIMYSSASVLNSCGVRSPRSSCDGQAVNNYFNTPLPTSFCHADGEFCYPYPEFTCH